MSVSGSLVHVVRCVSGSLVQVCQVIESVSESGLCQVVSSVSGNQVGVKC